MKKHTEMQGLEKGLYWYFENGKNEPEPVLVDPDKNSGAFRGFNGRNQSWLREGEYLQGPQNSPTAKG
ncbi:MAG: hypothetical protein QM500_04975 [Methylococcales bacterium]